VTSCTLGRLAGVWSRPDRDPRFHVVTVVVECEVAEPSKPPMNPMEITEVRLFSREELPADLAFGMQDMLRIAVEAADPVIE
jgi:8-oxo-dGTP diphosphatase